ncbi:uncharacterized protein PRCAT00002961001 [Priceomyces carsonii]|uniref:uncharacterized protein n=1 Tax=Priceomyces carsonii TaxID=28549 RepID=UPI002ED7D53C|nr:unnamed protein product [Priceomyces carsonii]
MGKVKKVKSTHSNRRHAFLSFRERVESIKIEPSLLLGVKVYDNVESSHFLSTLEHWKEVNLSENFTTFLATVEPYCYTLAQVIHHKGRIFDALFLHIERNDINSIQPLLELLAQFIHDLGEDFMVFYPSTLELLTKISLSISPNDSQNSRNSSNVLEWTFNCLAFAFKYLARVLCKDLIPTFRLVLPLFEISKRTYISKFCAEALSFLIRKLKRESLSQFVTFCFEVNMKSVKENVNYRESLVTLFSDSIKSTRGSFHSKMTIIISEILRVALSNKEPAITSIFSNIMLDIVHHGDERPCELVYELVLNEMSVTLVNSNDLDSILSICQVLSALVFADSGKKVVNWKDILVVTESLIAKISTLFSDSHKESVDLMNSLVFLISLEFRNCSIQEMTPVHANLFASMQTLNNGSHFLSFVEAGLDIARSKFMSFGIIKFLQKFVNTSLMRPSEIIKLSLLLSRLLESNIDDIQALEILEICYGEIKKYLKLNRGSLTDDALLETYWRLTLLNYCVYAKDNDTSYLVDLFECVSAVENHSKTWSEVIAINLEVLLKNLDDQTHASRLFLSILSNYGDLRKSSKFISSFSRFIKSCPSIKKLVLEEYEGLIEQTTSNLSLPNHDLRYQSILLLENICILKENSVPFVLSQVRILEEIPLTISSGRDIISRGRTLAAYLLSDSTISMFEIDLAANFSFGLLSNKFQPSWDAANEILISIHGSSSDTIWKLANCFLTMSYSTQFEEVPASLNSASTLLSWQQDESKLRDTLKHLDDTVFFKYDSPLEFALIEFSTHEAENEYSTLMRSRALDTLSAVPSVAESHSNNLVYLLSGKTNDEELTDLGDSWTVKDRTKLAGLFTKFKALNKIDERKKLYLHILFLLSNKRKEVQTVALNVLFNWKIAAINKHRDSLVNLLDDTTFKDEIAKFATLNTESESESTIDPSDIDELMPVVLHILFGRAQGSTKSNSKAGKKFAAMNVLPMFLDAHIIQFLEIGAGKLGYSTYFEKGVLGEITESLLRKVSGFVNLLSEIYDVLGFKFKNVLEYSINPLIYSLIIAQKVISDGEYTVIMEKSSKNIRQTGMRCFSELFKLMGEHYDWEKYISPIYKLLVAPRLLKFGDENLQQPSSLMNMMITWVLSSNAIRFLCIDDFACGKAMVLLLSTKAKNSVLCSVLEFSSIALEKNDITFESFYGFLGILVEALLESLPEILETSSDNEVVSRATKLLLLLVEGAYIDEESTRLLLIESLTKVLDKSKYAESEIKIGILKSLASLIELSTYSIESNESLYNTCSKLLKFENNRRVREVLVTVFHRLGDRSDEVYLVSGLLSGLNAYSDKRINEPDFEARLDSFKKINEELYSDFSPQQWLPILYCALHFIEDEDELVIRSNSSYILRRFVDCFSRKENEDLAQKYIVLFKDVVLPNLRIGIKHPNETIQNEYIEVLAYTVEYSKYFTDFDDMKILLFNNDDEANFFKNINHIQLHRRQRAIKRVGEYGNELKQNNISHYILPMIEHYAICTDEKFRNIANEALQTVSLLAKCISWNQYKALLKRYVANLRNKQDQLKDRVQLIVVTSHALMSVVRSKRSGAEIATLFSLPEQDILDTFVIDEIFPPIVKCLSHRNDETVVSRTPLSEALACLTMCVSENLIESQLPGVLTNTCQVLRSRSEELRDAVRKTLCKIVTLLGARYFRFLLKELKTALSRGSQIHVLSFTVHSLLTSIQGSLKHGDLDESSEFLVNIIMEDIFGAAGQEKDAEGYHSKMKEVKFKKSFDSGEILSSNISLLNFHVLIDPIKLLLLENISLKIQNKLDELLRKYALGLNHNSESSSKDILFLSYEMHQQSSDFFNQKNKRTPKHNEAEEHFMVKLSAKPSKTEVEFSRYASILQKFSLELLRTAITRHETLLSVSYLEGFLPLLDGDLNSDSEAVVISTLRILSHIIKLPFSEDSLATFKTCARRCLSLVKDSPSTNSEICQASLRFLSVVIRHRPEINLKDSLVSYILERVQPDLEEPSKQGVAFKFVKAVLSQHILIPEVYDVMNLISQIMVVNHSKEIRDMARSLYFTFLMEYDQSRGRLEKQFKFLVHNLEYPTPDGRQSVMELINSIVVKSSADLLRRLSSSFFIGLAGVLVNDDSARCREMAAALIASIFQKLDYSDMKDIETYCYKWIAQSSNSLLKRCGFSVYKIYISEYGVNKNKNLDQSALKAIESILRMSVKDENVDVEWELIYSSLSTFSSLLNILKTTIFDRLYENIWKLIVENLLFPHPWVRLISCRLIGILLTNSEAIDFYLNEYEIQTIAYRLLRQLGASTVSQELGTQIVKNLVLVTKMWESNETLYYYKASNNDESDELTKYKYAVDYLVARICSIMRHESKSMDSFISKKSSIQFCAIFIQLLSMDRLLSYAEFILLALYNFSELDAKKSEKEAELIDLSLECTQILEGKVGVTRYTDIYNRVKQSIALRRQERKSKRAQLALNAPDIAAKKKLRKHTNSREKRKHERDANGFYRNKRSKYS